MAHAYYVTGDSEQGIAKAIAFAKRELSLAASDPDLIVLRYLHFSVDEARKLADIAVAAPLGAHKAIVVATERFFHESQNALLKLFEEPPVGVTLVLVLPSEGVLLPTLRSRLCELPDAGSAAGKLELSPMGTDFLAADAAGRQKLIDKLVDRAKSDKDEEKQQARIDAVRLAEDLVKAGERAYRKAKSSEEAQTYRALLEDLGRFLPLLHTRSAPLKLVFEHLLIVIPTGLVMAEV